VAVAQHVSGEILQECSLFVAGNGFALRQIPRIQGLSAVQVNIDHPSAHEFSERFVGITTLQNRDQRARARHHQQLELRKKSLSSAALGHDQHVGVAEASIEGREW
jgi:hypothetical protein